MKRGNISFTLLVGLIVICSGATILSMSAASRYNATKDYERIEKRYVAESGVDLALGFFLNDIAEVDYTLSYTKNGDDSFYILDEYSPYLIEEIRTAGIAESISLSLCASESMDYLSGIGYLDFKRGSGIEASLKTFFQNDNFKLSRMCVDSNFLVSPVNDNSAERSRINPIYLSFVSQYKGGEVICDVKVSDLYITRGIFLDVALGEMGSVPAQIDVSDAKATVENYQNWR